MAPNWLLLGPADAAKGCLQFRYDEAPVATHCAEQYKYKGLDYPWDIAYGGSSGPCPENGVYY